MVVPDFILAGPSLHPSRLIDSHRRPWTGFSICILPIMKICREMRDARCLFSAACLMPSCNPLGCTAGTIKAMEGHSPVIGTITRGLWDLPPPSSALRSRYCMNRDWHFISRGTKDTAHQSMTRGFGRPDMPSVSDPTNALGPSCRKRQCKYGAWLETACDL